MGLIYLCPYLAHIVTINNRILHSEIKDMFTIFTGNLDCLRWKTKETTSGHGGSFLLSIQIIFANCLRSDVDYRRK